MGGTLDSSRFKTYLSKALKKPANDVSRGCGFQDIVNVIAITNIQAHLGMS